MGKSSGKKIRIKELDEFYTPYTVKAALTKGDVFTYITMLIMGFGNIVRGQIVKGLLFLGIEVAYLWFMITKGIGFLQMLPSLGWLDQHLDRTYLEEQKKMLEWAVEKHHGPIAIRYPRGG